MQRIRQFFAFLGQNTATVAAPPDIPNPQTNSYPQQYQNPFQGYPPFYNPALHAGLGPNPGANFTIDPAFGRGYQMYYGFPFAPMTYPGQPPPYFNPNIVPLNQVANFPSLAPSTVQVPPVVPSDANKQVNSVTAPTLEGNKDTGLKTVAAAPKDESLEWPNEYQRRECKATLSEVEKRKWKATKWVWRSSGYHPYNGRRAEKRVCLGVFSCSSPACGRLIRPKTNPSSRAEQLRDGCHFCRSPIINQFCMTAYTYHFAIVKGGEEYLVWVHEGHHSHPRPPGGPLSIAEEDALDSQVSRNPTASAHTLRTGDTTPGSVPLPEISSVLANPRAARYQLSQSQERIGISPPAAAKGGLSVLKLLFEFQKELETPFIIDSSIHGPVFITFQTPFMKSMLQASVDGWNSDAQLNPTSLGRHGFVTDGDHSFFSSGVLNMTCVFNAITLSWIPVLYTWTLRQDIDHHRPHFRHISRAVVEYIQLKNLPFERKYLLHVFDFSSAQRAAHAEEYAQAIIEITPGYHALSKASQEIEYKVFYDQAQEAQKGCSFHFWESAERVKSNGAIIPHVEGQEFTRLLRILVDKGTTRSQFDETVQILNSNYPSILKWLSWWLRPNIRSMIFPAYSALDPAISIEVPGTSNAAEHSHSLLHSASGSDHDLLPGIKKLFLHVKQLEAQFNSIKDGHYNPGPPRVYRPPTRKNWEPNDGRAPDTEAALITPPTMIQTRPALNVTRALKPSADSRNPSSDLTFHSYSWLAPNSCFVDNGLEIWFRAYCLWPKETRASFLTAVPSDSFLSSLFHHYDRRLKQLSDGTLILDYQRNLQLMQTITLHCVFNKWKLYADREAFGCAKTWLVHAVMENNINTDIQGYFGISHRIHRECVRGHSFSLPNARTEVWLTINDHDMKVAHTIYGPHVTTSDYFRHFIPRSRGGNYTGGTTPVHLLPNEPCSEPSCSAQSYTASISTLWPQILNINADVLRTDPDKLHFENTFSISDEDNVDVTYELVGRVLHINGNHFISQIRFKDRCYTYNDMEHDGQLAASDNPRLLEVQNDQSSVCYIYVRSSSKSETVRQEADIQIDYNQPTLSTESINLDLKPSNTSSDDQQLPGQLDAYPTESYTSCDACQYSELEPGNPLRGIPITCTLCVKTWHEDCIMMDDNSNLTTDDTWACPACINPHGGRWDQNMLELYILLRPNPTARFYPAKVLGRSATNRVNVEWYCGNIYSPNDTPKDKIGIFTPLECLQAKNRDACFEYTQENLGSIKWPARLDADAADNHNYKNQSLQNALEAAYGAILEILQGVRDHPIVALYNDWIRNRPRSIKMILQHHFNFTKQFKPNILPGDASLIDAFLTHLQSDTRKSKVLIESHWITSVGSVLFRHVILREYLGRRPCDDNQIFYLSYAGSAFVDIPEDDVYADAKEGTVKRILTDPEQVMRDLEMIPGLHLSLKIITDTQYGASFDGAHFAEALMKTGDLYHFFNTTESGLAGGPLFIPNSRLGALPKANMNIRPGERPKPRPRGKAATTSLVAPPTHRIIKASDISDPPKRKRTQETGNRRSKRIKNE